MRLASAYGLAQARQMSKNVPENCIDLVGTQCGVISRSQALAAGMTRAAIDWRLRAERWSKLGPGVYLVRTGPPTRQAELWRAILQAGPHAALSHQTAAELHKLTDRPSSLIHVTIPGPRRAMPPAGVVVHRSSRLAQAVHPTLQPPRTRIEETVLDLVPLSATSDEALSVICAACQRGLTVPELITQAMTARKKLRWRAELAEALGQISGGVHSLLEYRYLQFVERPHRLPLAHRQVKLTDGDQSLYLDNLYRDYRLCVELDGRTAHPEDRRWHDLRRVNAITAHGITVLRYGWSDINERPCQTAGQVATILSSRGWTGTPRRCSPACTALQNTNPRPSFPGS